MEYSEEMADAFVNQMLRERPDAVLMTGDLTYNGAVESHEDLAAKLARLPDAGVPVLVLPGNHDVDCPQAARFEGDSFERVPSATAEQFARIWGRFGYEGALSRDDASLSYVAELGAGGRLRALMLDCNAVEEPGAIPGATLAWAREQLEEAREAGARVIACSHQNVLQHAFVAYGYQMVGAEELLALYRDEGVVLNLGGHIHAQHYARPGEAGGAGSAAAGGAGEAAAAGPAEEADGADDAVAAAPFVDVATSALSVSPNQFAELYVRLLEPGGTGGSSGSSGADGLPVGGRLLDAAGAPLSAIAVSYATRQLDVSGWAARQGSDNPDLLGFAAYAREFFRASTRASFSSAAESAADAGADADELLAYIDAVNYGFFSGRLDLVEDRPDLDRTWAAASALSGLYLDYIFRIDPVRDENAFDVEG